jgi:DNA mismatch repair ATPase MutS
MLIVRDNNTPDKVPVLEKLRLKLEELKVVIRICKEIQAFPNFNSFQTSINQVIEIAKQNEGWKPPKHPAHLHAQYRRFRTRFHGLLVFQVGCYLELFDRDAVWAAKALGLKRLPPRKGFYARCGVPIPFFSKRSIP